jgi:membrane-associated protease RseP (regulator of RpoE activity)
MTQLNSDPGKVLAVIPTWTVDGKQVATPAAEAGFKAGDRISTVDGKKINAPEDIQKAELAAGGKPIVVTGTHADGQPFTITVTPRCSGGSCQMGVGIAKITTPLTAIEDGVVFPWQAFQVIVQGLGALVTGQVQGGLFGNKGLTGPIGIAAITAATTAATISSRFTMSTWVSRSRRRIA